jgi:hypothetical protein
MNMSAADIFGWGGSRETSLGSLCIFLALSAGGALAQGREAIATAAKSDATDLNELVVTAEKFGAPSKTPPPASARSRARTSNATSSSKAVTPSSGRWWSPRPSARKWTRPSPTCWPVSTATTRRSTPSTASR